MKYVWKTLKYIIITILVILALIFISVFIQTKVNPDKVPNIFGYKPFIVLSGSMETEIYKGDLVVVKNIDADKLQVNDIIAFRDDDNHVVTHRIKEIIDNNGSKEFITKGDNNNTEDVGTVLLEKVEGIYSFKINGLGNTLLVLQKPVSLAIMIGIIIVGGVLWIALDNSKMSKADKEELERLRKEKEESSQEK